MVTLFLRNVVLSVYQQFIINDGRETYVFKGTIFDIHEFHKIQEQAKVSISQADQKKYIIEENILKSQVLEELIIRNFIYNINQDYVELPSIHELTQIFEIFSRELIDYDQDSPFTEALPSLVIQQILQTLLLMTTKPRRGEEILSNQILELVKKVVQVKEYYIVP